MGSHWGVFHFLDPVGGLGRFAKQLHLLATSTSGDKGSDEPGPRCLPPSGPVGPLDVVGFRV